jgi:hypothetical protein
MRPRALVRLTVIFDIRSLISDALRSRTREKRTSPRGNE